MTIDSPQRQLQQACSAMDRAIRSGQPARVETWLDACPAVASDADLALELIYAEYVSRETQGSPPHPAEYYRRFPSLADRLKRLFEVDDLFKPNATAVIDDTATDTFRPLAEVPAAPRRVGPFEIRERLGGGGMGVVYRARQTKPTRDVALKLLKAGANAGAAELARFRRESEAIARLHHENIVTVYEVGSDNNQPYLAMEYIPGGDLHALLQGRPQSPEWSANLIATLAKAVDYAHANGVVHRDIKPGNILLSGLGSRVSGLDSTDLKSTSIDATPDPRPQTLGPIPKLTDFGLAALTGEAGLTRTGQVLGTLAYLAPEQAAATDAAAKPGVDIYALGAVLYECLTGRPPVVAESEAEALRQILNDEPMAPRKLRPNLSRDLETITLKCLQKEPSKRYATALELAEDLERSLKHEPILARPVGRIEAAMKWAKRKPSQAALAAVSVTAFAAIIAVTAIYTHRLRGTLNEVESQRQRAETQEIATQSALTAEEKRRAEAWIALEKLTDQLMEGSLGGPRNPDDQKKELEGILKTYEALAAEGDDDPQRKRAAASSLRQIARIQLNLGRGADSVKTYDTIETMLRALIASDAVKPSDRQFLARVLYERGRRALIQPGYNVYLNSLEAVELERSLPDADGPASRCRQANYWGLASIAARRDKQPEECEAAWQESNRLWVKLHNDDPANAEYRSGLATSYQSRGGELARRQMWAEAEAEYRRASEIRCPGGVIPASHIEHFSHADCLKGLASLSKRRGDTAASIDELRQALDLWDGLVAQRRNSSLYPNNYAETLAELSRQVAAANSTLDLEPYYLKARRYLANAAIETNQAEIVVALANVVNDHGEAHLRKSRYTEALASYAAAAASIQEFHSRCPGTPRSRARLATALAGAGRTLNQQAKYDRALEYWDALFAASPNPSATARLDRARSLAGAGQHAEAVKAALAVDIKEDAVFRMKIATVHAIAALAEDAPRAEYERTALDWLAKAVEKGVLKNPSNVTYLKTSRDWKSLRTTPEFERLLGTME